MKGGGLGGLPELEKILTACVKEPPERKGTERGEPRGSLLTVV